MAYSRKRKHFEIWEDPQLAGFSCDSENHVPTTDCCDFCPALRRIDPELPPCDSPRPLRRDPASELCARCKGVDFDALLSGPRYPEAKHLEPTLIGSVAGIWENSSCPFCRLLTSSIGGFGLDSQSFQGVMCSVIPWRADILEGFQSSQTSENVATQLVVELKKRDQPILPTNGSVPNITPIYGPSEPRNKLSGLRIPPYIDFDNVKTWIKSCEAAHRASCGATAGTVSPFFKSSFSVIDVNLYNEDCSQMLKCVDHRRTRYVALSYVWIQGNKGALRLRERKSLRLHTSGRAISATISDAVELCKKLGERYLWVDSLCIVGTPKQKRFQIRHMDSIYSHAAFTIVAGQDRDSGAGLPGTTVSRAQPSQNHEIALVRGRMLTLTRPSLSSHLSVSAWKSRGWTFQEGLLSRRCLIFTDQEVFFCCRRKMTRESLSTGSDNFQLDSRSSLQLSSDFITSRDLGSSWDYITYTRLINEYTKRKLTYHSDKLSALHGVTNLLSRQFGTPFITGHPIHNLVTSLCWFGSKPMVRQHRFPSWCWADWSGEIQQDFSLTQTPLEENGLAKLATVEPVPGGKQLLVTSSIATIALDYQGGENIASLFPRGTKKLSNTFYPRPTGTSFFAISSLNQFDMRTFGSQKTCEFLMLARLHDFNSKPALDSRPELEYVIAILTKRSGQHAERAGLLAIPASIWDQSSPRKSTVILE